MAYTFKHYSEHELEGLTQTELMLFELQDRMMTKFPDMDVQHIESMSADQMRAQLNPEPVAPKPQSNDVPKHLVNHPEWVTQAWRQGSVPTLRHSGPSFPAKVWDSQLRRMVHIGMYRTAADRDAAIADAKARRALGLPIKPTGQPTNGY